MLLPILENPTRENPILANPILANPILANPIGEPNSGEPNSGEPNSGEPNSGEPNSGEPNSVKRKSGEVSPATKQRLANYSVELVNHHAERLDDLIRGSENQAGPSNSKESNGDGDRDVSPSSQATSNKAQPEGPRPVPDNVLHAPQPRLGWVTAAEILDSKIGDTPKSQPESLNFPGGSDTQPESSNHQKELESSSLSSSLSPASNNDPQQPSGIASAAEILAMEPEMWPPIPKPELLAIKGVSQIYSRPSSLSSAPCFAVLNPTGRDPPMTKPGRRIQVTHQEMRAVLLRKHHHPTQIDQPLYRMIQKRHSTRIKYSNQDEQLLMSSSAQWLLLLNQLQSASRTSRRK